MKAFLSAAAQVIVTTLLVLLSLWGMHRYSVPVTPTTPRSNELGPQSRIEVPPAIKPLGPAPAGFAEKAISATAALFVADGRGNPQFVCTITMIKKTATGYIGLTAKHCTDSENFYVQFDEHSQIPFVRATLLATGGTYDCAIFQIDTLLNVATIPLGTDRLLNVGDPVVNVGMPHNLGKFYFHGYVVEKVAGTRLHKDDIVLQLPASGGSSGSAVLSESQQAIVAVVTEIFVPRQGGVLVTVATPVSQVREMIDNYNHGGRSGSALPQNPDDLFNFFHRRKY